MNSYVVKRNGETEKLSLDKLIKRVERLSKGLDVNPLSVAKKAIANIYDGISTSELDAMCISNASLMIGDDPDYSKLAARLLSSVIEKEVQGQGIASFFDSIEKSYENGLISEEVFDFVCKNRVKLEMTIDHQRNDIFEYFGLKTVYDRYLLRHPTDRTVIEVPQYFFMRVACGLSENVKEAIELYRLISSHDYLMSTPTLFNSGSKRQQMSSCYLLDSPQDSIEGIYKTYADVAMLSKFAGGIGLSYSRVRASGSLIKGTNGKSNGIIPFLKTLDSSVAAINQGGKRKGAACVYLETWHADVEEFLELRNNTGDHERRTHNLNLANWVPDLFMKRVDEDGAWSLFDPKVASHLVDLYGDKFEEAYVELEKSGKHTKVIKARDLYARMMKCLAETGNGWMNFKDASNVKSNQTKLHGNTIHSSNLCLHGDTSVLTKEGHFKISELVGKEVEIWGGLKWAKISNFQKTKEDADLVEVRFADGSKIVCTPYHKFPVGDSTVRACDLSKGMGVNLSEAPSLPGAIKVKGAYAKGFLVGDGTLLRNEKNKHGAKAGLWLYKPKFTCEGRILKSLAEIEPSLKIFRESDSRAAYFSEEDKNTGRKALYGISNINHELVKFCGEFKKKLPSEILNWDRESKIEFLTGLFDADGTALNVSDSRCYQLASIHKENLEMVQLMLKDLGINSKVSLMRGAELKRFADDQIAYECQPLYRISISNSSSRIVSKYFNFERLTRFDQNAGLKRNGRAYKTKPRFNIIDEVVPLSEKADVYCCGVPDTNQFALSCGIMSGNCTEILEVTNKDETAVCNLGSINLSNHVTKGVFDFEKLASTVKVAVKFLDRVVDRNFYPINEAKVSNSKWRPVGLGVMGLQDAFIKMKMPFDSEAARELNRKIFEQIYYNALVSSNELAKKNGAHELFEQTWASEGKLQFDLWGVTPEDNDKWESLKEKIKEHGLRNSLLIAVAPTATISSIVGCEEGIEPIKSNLYKRETLSGEFIQINKHLVDLLKSMDLWNPEMAEELKRNGGSIQKIESIPAQIRDCFKTVWEIPMKSLVDMGADRGAYIDQSQSLNLFIESPTIGKLSSMYMYAWKKGIKTTYYLRSRPATEIAKSGSVPTALVAKKEVPVEAAIACSLENPEACESCQ